MSRGSPYSKNTPAYQRRKKCIVYFYTLSGVNAILTSVMPHIFNTEPCDNLFLLGILFIGMIPFVWIDKRKDNNSKLAVIGSAVVHFSVTLICAAVIPWIFPLIVYLCEMCLFFVLWKTAWLRL